MNLSTYKKGIIVFLLIIIFASWCLISANTKTNQEVYQEKLEQLKPDDIDGYYQLGLWCLENKLEDQAKIQFNKVVELDPNHEGARKNLGYVKYKDKWLTRDEAMKTQGYFKFEGQWVTPKEREDRFLKELIKKLGPPKGVLDKPGADAETLPWDKAREKETDHFIVKTNLSIDALNDICFLLEYAYFNYQDLFGCEQTKDQKLRVMVGKNSEEYKRIYYDLTGAKPPSYVAGALGYFMPAAQSKSKQDHLLIFYQLSNFPPLTGVLQHECTHYAIRLMAKKYGRSHPLVWFDEGWATYCEANRLEGEKLVTNVINQRLARIKTALAKQTHSTDPVEQAYIKLNVFINMSLAEHSANSVICYPEGWSLVYFLLNGQNGKYKPGLQAYMESWVKGKIIIGKDYAPQDKIGHLKLFEKCMGVPIDQLEEEWKEYISQLKQKPNDPIAPEPKKKSSSGLEGFTALGKNPQGYEEYRHETTGMVFVLIPSGTFQMGSNDSDSEKPVHEVAVNSFLISKFEVTQGVWQKVIGSNPSKFKKGDNYPVEQVSWDDCQEFCKKAELRLPTEAEWEYATRAGTTTKYYWGDKDDGDYMWCAANSGSTTHPVGEKKPNGFGLYDISGNVWEWCQDWYEEGYYKNSPKDNPQGPSEGQDRVLRGGSWGTNGVNCRSGVRAWGVPSGRYNLMFGFRCVRDLK